jgi:limonene 1,2-monooxygenase
MEFGLFAMPEHYPWENWTLAYDRDLATIVKAEQLGFEEFWIGEHHSGGYEPIPAPDLFLAKAAGLTSRIRLGTGTVNLPYHDPFIVAERLAFLDHLLHGRLLYGLGGGGLPSDRELLGMPGEESRPRTQEAIDIIERLLTTREPFSVDGRFWQFRERRLQVAPYQAEPPIAVAGLTGTHNFTLCGERGFIPLSVYFTPAAVEANPGVPDLAAHGAALEDGARAAGRDPAAARARWRITRECYVADSRGQALDDIRAGVRASYEYLLALGLGALMKRDQAMRDADLTFEWMVENVPWIVGTPDECIDQIGSLDEAVGGFGVLLINNRDWTTSDLWHRSLERFARQVIPAFRARDHQELRRELAAQALARAQG